MRFKLRKNFVVYYCWSASIYHVEEVEQIFIYQEESLCFNTFPFFKISEHLLKSFVLNRSGRGHVYFFVCKVVFSFDKVKPMLHPGSLNRIVSVVFAGCVLM